MALFTRDPNTPPKPIVDKNGDVLFSVLKDRVRRLRNLMDKADLPYSSEIRQTYNSIHSATYRRTEPLREDWLRTMNRAFAEVSDALREGVHPEDLRAAARADFIKARAKAARPNPQSELSRAVVEMVSTVDVVLERLTSGKPIPTTLVRQLEDARSELSRACADVLQS